MDEKTLERAKARIAEAASGRIAPAELEAALERTRIQVESLAAAAAELEGTLPEKVSAVQKVKNRTVSFFKGCGGEAFRRLGAVYGSSARILTQGFPMEPEGVVACRAAHSVAAMSVI